MKRIIAALIIAVLILSMAACGKGGDLGSAKEANGEPAVSPEDLVSTYNKMLEEAKKPNELMEFAAANIKNLNKEQATDIIGALLSRLEAEEYEYNEKLYSDSMQELMFKYFSSGFDKEKIKLVQEQDIKLLLEELTAGGYKILAEENCFSAIVDYGAVKNFYDYISDELKDYVEIMSLRYEQYVSVDNVQLTWDRAIERIIKAEEYIKKYDSKAREEMIQEVYTGYLMEYLGGMDNMPAFDYDTEMLFDGMLEIYSSTIEKHSNTYIAAILKEYLSLLEQEAFIYTEAVQDYIMNINETVARVIE